MTIKPQSGNLLLAQADALVNTVNTVGVAGKGIALQFRQTFPENFRSYERAAKKGDIRPGEMFVTSTGAMQPPHYIINFPTKGHWRAKARLADIETGLEDLARVLDERQVRSVAVPPLGCGLGGLQWEDVRPRIEAALGRLDHTRVLVFESAEVPMRRS